MLNLGVFNSSGRFSPSLLTCAHKSRGVSAMIFLHFDARFSMSFEGVRSRLFTSSMALVEVLLNEGQFHCFASVFISMMMQQAKS